MWIAKILDEIGKKKKFNSKQFRNSLDSTAGCAAFCFFVLYLSSSWTRTWRIGSSRWQFCVAGLLVCQRSILPPGKLRLACIAVILLLNTHEDNSAVCYSVSTVSSRTTIRGPSPPAQDILGGLCSAAIFVALNASWSGLDHHQVAIVASFFIAFPSWAASCCFEHPGRDTLENRA